MRKTERRISARALCRGPKVLLGEVSRRCYREPRPDGLIRPSPAHGGEPCINDFGERTMTMAATAGGDVRTGGMTAEERKVIFASSLGTVFEWYDFYIYGTLGAFLAKYFFSNVPPNVGFIFALLAFAAGFAVRPFGALIFGRLGDMIGRKYTFLITMTLMGIGTFFIGLLPGYATWGIRGADRSDRACGWCRVSRSAANMAAPRSTSPSMRRRTSAATTPRGFRPPRRSVCSWRCCSFSASAPGWAKQSFGDWGWRIPFLLSGILLARLDLDPLEPERVADLPEDEGRGQDLEAPAERSLRPNGRMPRSRSWRCWARPPVKPWSGMADSSMRCSS